MYLTFCLCSATWPPSEKTLDLIDRVIDWVSPKGSLDVIARVRADDPRNKPNITGDYRACRRELAERPIKSLRIASRSWRPDSPAELYLFLENERPNTSLSPTASSTDPRADFEAASALKMFTFSIRRDIWNDNQETTSALLTRIEEFLVESNFCYGYGHECQHIISGPFDLIEGASSTRPLRFMDFDYRRGIIGIYRYNYLSDLLLGKVDQLESLCQIGGVTCKTLGDSPDATKGVALYVDRYESEVLSNVVKHLRPLLNAE